MFLMNNNLHKKINYCKKENRQTYISVHVEKGNIQSAQIILFHK